MLTPVRLSVPLLVSSAPPARGAVLPTNCTPGEAVIPAPLLAPMLSPPPPFRLVPLSRLFETVVAPLSVMRAFGALRPSLKMPPPPSSAPADAPLTRLLSIVELVIETVPPLLNTPPPPCASAAAFWISAVLSTTLTLDSDRVPPAPCHNPPPSCAAALLPMVELLIVIVPPSVCSAPPLM